MTTPTHVGAPLAAPSCERSLLDISRELQDAQESLEAACAAAESLLSRLQEIVSSLDPTQPRTHTIEQAALELARAVQDLTTPAGFIAVIGALRSVSTKTGGA